MNAKLQQLNEKILLLSKTVEQNRNNLKKYEKEREEEKNYETNPIHKSKFETKIPISQGSLMKSKLNILEDEYNTKKEDFNVKLDFLIDLLENLRKKIDNIGEEENHDNKERLESINKIKENFLNDFKEHDNKINTIISNANNLCLTKLSEIKNENNLNNNDYLKYMIQLSEESSKKLIEIDEKILNLNEIEKKESDDISSNICNKFSEFDDVIKKSSNENNQRIIELNKQLSSFSHNIIPTFMNQEREKREEFQNNIFSILNDTENKL